MSSDKPLSRREAPPILRFDDGSRAMQQQHESQSFRGDSNHHPRGHNTNPTQTRPVSRTVRDYYEIDRIVQEIISLRASRVALQFPDEMLCDAPAVCEELDYTLNSLPPSTSGTTTSSSPTATTTTRTTATSSSNSSESQYLIFCLGDTTFAPCCPDFVAAAHLQADCIVHYGHACFTSSQNTTSEDIPVVYVLLQAEWDPHQCAEQVSTVRRNMFKKISETTSLEDKPCGEGTALLILYEVQYGHNIDQLQSILQEQYGFSEVMVGRIPSRCSPCSNNHHQEVSTEDPEQTTNNRNSEIGSTMIGSVAKLMTMGGLEIPLQVDLKDCTLLYVGSDTTRQYMNITLRFLSCPGPKQFWTFNPVTNSLSNEPSPTFQRLLHRRFYLIEKAKQCNVFGILVASVSDHHLRTVVASLQDVLEVHGRSSYTMVVGKLNPNKLANFPEVECFVLVACSEHTLLSEQREYATPVITPLELVMALGIVEWGKVPYSPDSQDYLNILTESRNIKPVCSDNGGNDESDGGGADDDDAPYFSPITGRYEARSSRARPLDLRSLPGQGQLSMYTSAATNALKQREYQGLQVNIGVTEVHVAKQGQEGIASNYGNR